MEKDRDVKRTYKLTDQEVKVIDRLSESTPLNRSQIVGRMVRHYFLDLRNGELNDPMITEEMRQRFEENMADSDKKDLTDKVKDLLGS